MNRTDAIALLAERILEQLSSEVRHSLLLDWWSIEGDDPEYPNLQDELRLKLATLDGPDEPTDPSYDPLLLLALRRSFVGVLNRYLENQLERLGRRRK